MGLLTREDYKKILDDMNTSPIPRTILDFAERVEEEVRKKLTQAIQAHAQQLRKALEIANNAGYDEWYPYSPEQAKNAINEALALPQDTSALEALIQKAGEVMRKRCFAIGHSNSVDKSIRALPAVTLKDL